MEGSGKVSAQEVGEEEQRNDDDGKWKHEEDWWMDRWIVVMLLKGLHGC